MGEQSAAALAAQCVRFYLGVVWLCVGLIARFHVRAQAKARREQRAKAHASGTVSGGDGRSAEDNDDSGGGNGGDENGECGEDKETADGRTQRG